MKRMTKLFTLIVCVSAGLALAQTAEDKTRSEDQTAPQTSKWKKRSESQCSMEFFPASPTYMRRYRDTLRTHDGNVVSEYRETISSMNATSATLKKETLSSSAAQFVGDVQVSTTSCNQEGTFSGPNHTPLAVLRIGSLWTINPLWTINQSAGTDEFSTNCIAKQNETIAVPAGSFDAIRVECRSVASSKGEIFNDSTSKYWYSSGVGLIKASCCTSNIPDQPGPSKTTELAQWVP